MMENIASLIKALKDTAVAQYGKGALYREALASALKGDMSSVNQALSKSDLTPVDFALMMGVNSVGNNIVPGLLKNAYSGIKPESSTIQFKRTFKLNDGSKISGTNSPDNSVLYGYDKNGEKFTIRTENLTPDKFENINEYNSLFGSNITKNPKTEFEMAHELAQQRAALPVSKGGLGLPTNNTAMDRANAMGNTTKAYTGANIEGEIDSMLPKSWFSKEPEYSSKYSTVIPSDGISKDPRMYPVLINTGKTEVSPMFGLYEDMEKALAKKKTNTFKVEGVGGGTNDFYVPKEGSQVRSIFAAFDPFRRNENDILAGVGAGLPFVDYNNKK